MKSGKRRELWSVEKFSAVAAAQRESGLSVQAYCLREGVNLSTFYRWRDRVAPLRRRRALVKQDLPRDEFIPLGAMPVNSRLELRFDLGDGVTLTVTR